MQSHGARLVLSDVTVAFGDQVAVDRVDLAVEAGELVVLLGPSGCGKTTLLRVIAGFARLTGGSVQLDGIDVTGLPPEDRRVGIVFQNYALFPHMTVAENVAYGLEAHRAPKATIAEKVREMLAIVRMTGFERRLPRELSGGQQQRVALARALAISPRVLLLDEPFAALDKNLRQDVQIEVLNIQRALGITTVMVTHDQSEALAMADRIAVMQGGQIVQLGDGSEIYDRPATTFVSGFVGNATLVDGELAKTPSGQWSLRTETGIQFVFQSAGPCRRVGRALLALRPEHLELADEGEPATVQFAKPMGSVTQIGVTLRDGTGLHLSSPRSPAYDRLTRGERVALRIRADAVCPVFLP